MKKYVFIHPLWAALLVGFFCAGCDEDGDDNIDEDTDSNQDSDTAPADTESDTAPADSDSDSAPADSDSNVMPPTSHVSDIQPIWNSKCTPCHINGSSGSLSLKDDAYFNIVDVASKGSSLDLIEPSDTALSYIWHKLNNTQDSVEGGGGAMPPKSSETLSNNEWITIETWITDGALYAAPGD